MYLIFKETRQLKFHAENFVAEWIHASFFRGRKGLLVVFEGIFRLDVVVGIVEGAAELSGNGFGEGGEFADNVGLVEVVGIDETDGGADDAGGRRVSFGNLLGSLIDPVGAMELPERSEGDGERVFIVKLTSSYWERFVSSLRLVESEWLEKNLGLGVWSRVPLRERAKGGSAGFEVVAKNWSTSSRAYPCG